jgi:hypothetical protein
MLSWSITLRIRSTDEPGTPYVALQIACPPTYHRDALRTTSEFVAEQARKYNGAVLRFEQKYNTFGMHTVYEIFALEKSISGCADLNFSIASIFFISSEVGLPSCCTDS